jgi:hypothetical protein
LNAFPIPSKRARNGENALKEFAEIRTVVGADRCTSLSRYVSALVKEYREYQTVRQQIENNQHETTQLLRQGRVAHDGEKMSREWETWSNCPLRKHFL